MGSMGHHMGGGSFEGVECDDVTNWNIGGPTDGSDHMTIGGTHGIKMNSDSSNWNMGGSSGINFVTNPDGSESMTIGGIKFPISGSNPLQTYTPNPHHGKHELSVSQISLRPNSPTSLMDV